MKKIILSAKDMCKSFAVSGTQNHVLDMVNLDIYAEDFTVIMGSSGSGKSTLLYCLSGMDKPTAGAVSYAGEVISSYSERQMAKLRAMDFGFVFQQMQLVSNLTLLENVLVTGYQNKEKTSSEVKERALRLLSEVNIINAKDRLPSQVSGGEAQRAAIVRAMINEPSLIFADEPTGALNRRNTKDVMNLLTEINSQGQSILMVTHDVRASIRGTRLIYLEDGKIKGEMQLSPYNEAEVKSRETQVNAWLASMEW